MKFYAISPSALGVRLVVYFAVVVGALFALVSLAPSSVAILPIGGLELDLPGTATEFFESLENENVGESTEQQLRLEPSLVLLASLVGTILLMVPITWVYMAIKQHDGFRKSFVAALLVLPICATSIVLLIQDSLALAFGLAALVGAVRFRVVLDDALDGIYVFAAICVGLSSGVGYLGVGGVMTVVFCFALLVIWGMDYGANRVEEAKQARKRAKLEVPSTDSSRYP